MKTNTIRIVGLLLIFLISCKKDDAVSPTDILDQRLQMLSKTWVVGNVRNDGSDVSGRFNEFSLTISLDKSFTTTQGGNAWTPSGNFSFMDGNENRLLRNDGVELAILSINENDLVIQFNQPDLMQGRNSGVTGDFIFTLTSKQS